MSAEPLVVERYGRRYSATRPWAVRDISFAVPAGSITAIVGPNGAGKSTLIRACVGFERPDEGRILVRGFDPTRWRDKAVGYVGYIPQTPTLYRNFSIGDHLDMGQAARPSFDRRYALDRVRAFGLNEQRLAAELSGGEQAQVVLALVLGTRAELLLLDEPLASLDPLARRDFLGVLLEDVQSRGATAILSSHIVTDIEEACDRLLVLAGGRLVLDSSVEAAKNEFRSLLAAESEVNSVVATFRGPKGEQLALVRGSGRGRRATLEEIVLGHLAAARTIDPAS